MKRHHVFMGWRFKIVKMTILPEMIHRLNAVTL